LAADAVRSADSPAQGRGNPARFASPVRAGAPYEQHKAEPHAAYSMRLRFYMCWDYPFTAPMRNPCMKYFWKAKKKRIMGMAASAAPAISRP
jgi:hypothetical protein